MIVLGSTGSIGRNALFLADKFKLNVSALSCGKNMALLNEQIAKFRPKFVCIGENADKTGVKFDKNRIFVGQNGLEKMLESCEDNLVLNAIVGFAGLRASLKTKELNKHLALANKESLVVAGKFLSGAKITPIDSEHSALKFLLAKHDKKDISRLIITASGGAFFKLKNKDLKKVTPKMALKHPNWAMGAKITIDSATMANKLFEIIEAYHLFGFKNIDALIEPKSLIHALCEFKDGGTTAYFSRADMKLAIAQAILPFLTQDLRALGENFRGFEKKNSQNSNAKAKKLSLNKKISQKPTKTPQNPYFSHINVIKPLDFFAIPKLKFFKISPKKYPLFSLKNELLAKPDLGVIINAANEVQVAAFLAKRCGFLGIADGVFKALNHFGEVKISSLDELFEIDKKVRDFCKALKN